MGGESRYGDVSTPNLDRFRKNYKPNCKICNNPYRQAAEDEWVRSKYNYAAVARLVSANGDYVSSKSVSNHMLRHFQHVRPTASPRVVIDRSLTNVYFIAQNREGPIKIGQSHDIEARLRALQASSPVPLVVLAVLRGCPPIREKQLHKRFQTARLHFEWFHPVPDLLALIDHINQKEDRRVFEREKGSAIKRCPFCSCENCG